MQVTWTVRQVQEKPAMASTNANQRQRMWTPKTRTGCNTCRQRRIKCDEAWPCCLRCVSSGRSCEGYQMPIIQYQSTTGPGRTSSRIRKASQPRERQLSLVSRGSSSPASDSTAESTSPEHAVQPTSSVSLPIRSIQPSEPHHRLLKYFISAVGSFVIPLGHSFSTSAWAAEWSRHAISRPLLLAAICCRASAFHDSFGWPHRHSRRTLQLRNETFVRLKDAVVCKRASSDPYETIGAILMLMADNYTTMNLPELESHISGLNNIIDRRANRPPDSPLRLWMDAGIRWQFAPCALLLLQNYYHTAQTILSRLPIPALTPASLLSFDALDPTFICLFDVLQLSSTEQQVSHALSTSFSTDRSDLEFSIVTYYQHARQFTLSFDGDAGDSDDSANVTGRGTKPPGNAAPTTAPAALLAALIRRLHCIALLTFTVTLLRKYSLDTPTPRAGASVLLSDAHVLAGFDFSTAQLTREQAQIITWTTCILREFTLEADDLAMVDGLSQRAALEASEDENGDCVFYPPAWRAWKALCQAVPSAPAIRRC